MRKPRSRRNRRATQQDLKRLALPKGIGWWSDHADQIAWPVYGSNGFIITWVAVILIDKSRPVEPVDGWFGPAGLYDDADGRWYRLDFDGQMWNRKVARLVRRAAAVLAGGAHG